MTDEEELELEQEDREIDLMMAREKAISNLFKVVLNFVSTRRKVWTFNTYKFMQRRRRV